MSFPNVSYWVSALDPSKSKINDLVCCKMFLVLRLIPSKISRYVPYCLSIDRSIDSIQSIIRFWYFHPAFQRLVFDFSFLRLLSQNKRTFKEYGRRRKNNNLKNLALIHNNAVLCAVLQIYRRRWDQAHDTSKYHLLFFRQICKKKHYFFLPHISKI